MGSVSCLVVGAAYTPGAAIDSGVGCGAMGRTGSIAIVASLALLGCRGKDERGDRAAGAQPAATHAAPATPPDRVVPPLPDPLPGMRHDVSATAGAATRVAIGDLDGDGQAELVFADAARLWVVDRAGRELASVPAPGAIHVLAVADLDGDGRAEIAAGWGFGRDHRDARTRVVAYRLVRDTLVEELIDEPASERHEVASIVPPRRGEPELLLATYASKYVVRIAAARRRPGKGGWTVEERAAVRMGTSHARGDLDGDGTAELVIGRVYGDQLGDPGDALVLWAGAERSEVPTVRGVRGLALGDSDGDGKDEVFLGDGWDRDYGKVARGLVSWARLEDGAMTTELIEDTPGQYTVWQIEAADLDGDGKIELVTRGSHYVRIYRRVGPRWQGVTIAGPVRHLAVGPLDDRPGDEILLLGDKAEIVGIGFGDWPR
jgi:hypothetical protein